MDGHFYFEAADQYLKLRDHTGFSDLNGRWGVPWLTPRAFDVTGMPTEVNRNTGFIDFAHIWHHDKADPDTEDRKSDAGSFATPAIINPTLLKTSKKPKQSSSSVKKDKPGLYPLRNKDLIDDRRFHLVEFEDEPRHPICGDPKTSVLPRPPKAPKLAGLRDLQQTKQKARSASSKLPRDWAGIAVAGSEELSQHLLWMPAWQNTLIADQRSKDEPTFSTKVADLTGENIDQKKTAGLQTIFRVSGAWDELRCVVALELGAPPDARSFQGGYFRSSGLFGKGPPAPQPPPQPPSQLFRRRRRHNRTDEPTENIITIGRIVGTGQEEPGPRNGTEPRAPDVPRLPSVAALGLLGESGGGPISTGSGIQDKHLVGVNADGEPVVEGHVQTNAFFHMDQVRDAPLEFLQAAWIDPASSGIYHFTELKHDTAIPHPRYGFQGNGGTAQGLWRWETKVPVYSPSPPDRERPPSRNPDPLDPNRPEDPTGTPGDPFEPEDVPELPDELDPSDVLEIPRPEQADGAGSGVRATPVIRSPKPPTAPTERTVGFSRAPEFIAEGKPKRNIRAGLYSWMEFNATAMTFQPTPFSPNISGDMRYTRSPTPEQQSEIIKRPHGIRLELSGAQKRDGWNYTEKPEVGRYHGGTLNSTLWHLPPELSLDDLDRTEEISDTGIGFHKTSMAFGLPVVDGFSAITGKMTDGVRFALNESSTLLEIACIDSAGLIAELLTFPCRTGTIATTDQTVTDILTTQGDIIYHDGAGPARLGVGAATEVLTVVAGEPSWQPGGRNIRHHGEANARSNRPHHHRGFRSGER